MTSLKQKSFHGIVWSFVDNIAGSGISFIVGIVLARLLEPSVFGLIGMVTIFFALSNTFIDSGFSVGLIRKVQCSDKEYNTVFLFNITISLLLYFILAISAPFIADFFKEPSLILIVRVLGIVIVIDSFSIVQRVLLVREMNFKKQTKISLTASVVSGIIGIGMAFLGYGVWSLIVQILTRQSLIGILFWISSKWRPAIVFSIIVFKELFTFGSKLLGTSLIMKIQNNIYYFIIGRYFSATNLGYYTRAEQFNSIVISNITGPIERVFFPSLSSIQDDKIHLKDTLRKMFKASFFITFLSIVALAAVARPLILITIGSKWETSVLYLQLLSIGSVFFPLNILNSNILKIMKRSDLILKLQIIKALLLIPVIIIGIKWGIVFMLFANLGAAVVSAYLNSIYSGSLINYCIKEQILDILPYLLSGFVIALSMFAISLTNLSNVLMISLQLVIGSILFLIIFECKKLNEYVEIKNIIKNEFVLRILKYEKTG